MYAEKGNSMRVKALDHLVLTARDITATIAFYGDVLGMEPEVFEGADGTRRHALKFGAQKINLHETGAEFEPKAARATAGSGDLCFLSEGVIEDWLAHLAVMGVRVELGPVLRTGATGPITSIYLRDPDGNLVEVSVPA